MSESKTIDLMLRMLHRRRIVWGDYLANLSLCVSLIGPRGSGKSVGATAIGVTDGLLAGRRVVSNLPLAVKVRYKDCSKVFESEDLDAVMMLSVNDFDQNYGDCMMVVDEVNLALADSLRSTSNQALDFSYILQQMRHRNLNFIFTTQNEMWQTNRMRYQVDLYIACSDNAMRSGGKPKKEDIGRKSHWDLHDVSGLITGKVLHDDLRTFKVPPYKEVIAWNVPYWNCYSTDLMQKREKFARKQEQESKEIGFDEEHLERLAREYQTPASLLNKCINLGIETMLKADTWAALGITDDRAMQTKVGSILTKLGCQSKHNSTGHYYIFPSQATMLKNLSALGLTAEMKGDQDNG